MQFLPLRFTILEAGLQVNDIYISMLPGGLWVQLLEDGGRGDGTSENPVRMLAILLLQQSWGSEKSQKKNVLQSAVFHPMLPDKGTPPTCPDYKVPKLNSFRGQKKTEEATCFLDCPNPAQEEPQRTTLRWQKAQSSTVDSRTVRSGNYI